ncbi:hypothetical protein C2I18_08590 [Paenibacillus sp. PK3_47]|uniref:hypothetical protein n=1 Tax=Paenibacillus sp. PK3_47 TaxID=2072642 RepID=UPI00201D49FE|nr:hypothetical protein [Paenibacillus sp. PK3_47]UQZ33596.1 hypothetical protein C2I18_08590 [Paenibacillus sp. PK3_47]
MDPRLTLDIVRSIAKAYKRKYKLSGDISDHLERSIQFYGEFDNMNGPVWLVRVSVAPDDFFAENEFTMVISDTEAAVKYMIDPNGHVHSPHL